MTAISSASRYLPPHAISVVCLSPVSPLTKYATGSADRTGMRRVLVLIGTVGNSESAALDCTAACSTSVATSSG
jgi:hypothetical protein